MKKEKINKDYIYIDEFIDISDSNIINTIKNIYNLRQNVLVVSPTGTRKTATFLQLAKEVIKDNDKRAIIFATPNRAQSEQNAVEYGVTVIVGGVVVNKLTLKNKQTCSAVYEKVEAIAKDLTENGLEVTLIIDEAHELIDSYTYRDTSIQPILGVIKVCEHVIYITATPEVLLKNNDLFEIDKVFEFKLKTEKQNACEFQIIEYENNLKDIVLDTILKESKDNRQGIVRINNKIMLSDLKYNLDLANIETELLIGENKKTSSVYNSIISDSKIPENIKLLGVTSLLDSGVNIKNTQDSYCIFVCQSNEFSFTAIEQFSNRFRNKYNKFILIKKKNMKIYSADLIVRELKTKQYISNILKMCATEDFEDNEARIVTIRGMIKSLGLDNTGNGFVPYIKLNEETLEIYEDKYHRAAFIQRLDHIQKSNSINYIKKRLHNISNNITVKSYGKTDIVKDFSTELKEIKKVEKIMKATDYNKFTENLKKMLSFTNGLTNKKKDEFAKKLIDIIGKPANIKYIPIFKLIEKDLEKIVENIEEIDKSIIEHFLEKISEMFAVSLQYYNIVSRVSNTTKQVQISKLQKELDYINLNIKFKDGVKGLEDIYSLSVDAREYAIIRNILDLQIQKRITKEALNYISEQISPRDSDGNIIKRYSNKTLYNRISFIYSLTSPKTNSKGETTYMISALKTKLKTEETE